MSSTELLDILDVFENPDVHADYTVRIKIPEFTCLCPKTGQPDFALLHIEYVPDSLCVELKSLKLYVAAYRNIGTFHEAVTNRIRADLVAKIAPRFLRVTAQFNIRGGIQTTVVTDHAQSNWQPPPSVVLPS